MTSQINKILQILDVNQCVFRAKIYVKFFLFRLYFHSIERHTYIFCADDSRSIKNKFKRSINSQHLTQISSTIINPTFNLFEYGVKYGWIITDDCNVCPTFSLKFKMTYLYQFFAALKIKNFKIYLLWYKTHIRRLIIDSYPDLSADIC